MDAPQNKRGPYRRRAHTGPVAKNYFKRWKSRAYGRTTYLRERERLFAEYFAEGFLSVAPLLMSASERSIRKVIRKLGMDCVERSPYRCRGEAALNRQALCLMNMPRVQIEIDTILARKGMSTERMAARLAQIMEGKAEVETRKYVYNPELQMDVLTERTVQTNSVADSLRAIDITLKVKGQYAPTNAKVTINSGMPPMFDAETYDATPEIATPEIAVDTNVALESQKADMNEDEDDVENEEDEHPEDCDCNWCTHDEDCECDECTAEDEDDEDDE